MKVLHLNVKKKWFDMIAIGEKKEEYREIKMYWWKRLVQCGECYKNLEDSLNDKLDLPDNWKMIMAKSYNIVEFKNGYGKDAPIIKLEFKGITVGKAKPEWSDNLHGDVFVISLGSILKEG